MHSCPGLASRFFQTKSGHTPNTFQFLYSKVLQYITSNALPGLPTESAKGSHGQEFTKFTQLNVVTSQSVISCALRARIEDGTGLQTRPV